MPISIPIEVMLSSKKVREALKTLGGESGLKTRYVQKYHINRPGLLLSGYDKYFHFERIQVFGRTEIEFLKDIGPKKAKTAIKKFFSYKIPCVIISSNNRVPKEMVRMADESGTPLFVSEIETENLINRIQEYLEEKLAPLTSVHGVLIDMYGVGVLIEGKSGIGKSETALELIQRGHRLVADDIVDIHRLPGPRLIGEGSEIIRHHMEVRGLGIINIKQTFGVGAIRERKKIDMVVELEEWQNSKEYDRLGFDDVSVEILGVDIPRILVPVRPGRNLAVIVEVGAMNQRLKGLGFHPAIEFNKQLLNWIQKGQ